MALTAINGVRTANPNIYNINFTSRRKKDNPSIQTQERTGNNLAKVPVIVMLAMSPAMLNAGNNKAIQLEEGQLKEILAQIPEDESVPTAEFIQGTEQTKSPVVPFLRFANIKKVVPAKGNDVSAKLFLIANITDGSEDVVRDIYYVKDSDIKEGKYKNDYERPPRVEKVIYHDLGEDEFIGIGVFEEIYDKDGVAVANSYREIRLDDNSAQYVADLLADKTRFQDKTNIPFTVSKNPDLMRPRFTKKS